ncbi:MAG TPA: aminotransferase class V-fold PLP-dependent enzyme [Smithellaceae bacterium]|jgi:cysteine desulfurase family protein|nr:aminotransferase class V-fold PLP-dependent enzyme [Smithellaceae bacterium]HQC20039.1 aminotransferase class V-fold PLP-dependent enzyme [Smithella sp.]HOM70466.1 aminotransferase class V-fold PLP-dependent enzyme [Smithellaceae bacterium]HOS08286.1 aminotransferase class V-fold PLP-dependent enzyme [Smithellaceae bacterium]HOU04054.1 aminotransferase class V-fold PLP-dependent enzyme [Smithellaceae bacterium]
MKKNIIYFDNAATSWPKPPQTLTAMQDYLQNVGGSPGRSGHRLSLEAARIVFETREMLSQLFNVPDPLRIVLTRNATESLNIAIFGLLNPGDHVITSDMEHNSVMRPLRAAEARGVDITVVPCGSNGLIDPGDVVKAIRTNTKAIFITNASNVTGTIMPIADIGKIAREHDLVLCVDAAQTAGCYPIDVEAMHIDLLAFTGHKSLFGPSGTGGLYIRDGLENKIEPICFGGTGSRSELEVQPNFMPDRYESGTPNTIGIAGLTAGIEFIRSKGLKNITAHEKQLTGLFLQGIEAIKGVTVYGIKDEYRQIPVVSFNIQGMDPAKVSLELDEQFEIMSRPGLHCAPAAHKTLGTYPSGTVRFSFSCFNTEEQIIKAIEAIRQIGKGRKRK